MAPHGLRFGHHGRDLGCGHDVEGPLDALGIDLDQIRVGRGDQSIQEFHHVGLAAQGPVDRPGPGGGVQRFGGPPSFCNGSRPSGRMARVALAEMGDRGDSGVPLPNGTPLPPPKAPSSRTQKSRMS